jgi:hypothetical protein
MKRLVSLCLFLALALNAADKKPVKKSLAKPSTAAPGSVISKDPVTGELREPTIEERQALTSLTVRRLSAATPIVGAGGAIGMAAPEEAMSFMVVTKGPDGKLIQRCVQGSEMAAKVLKSAPGSSAPVKGDLDVK